MILFNIIELHTIFTEIGKEKLKAGLAHKIAQFINILQPHFEQYEKTRVSKIIELCGEDNKNENGSYNVPQEKMSEFIGFLNEYVATELEIQLPSLTLDDIKDLDIQPNHLNVLMKMKVLHQC